MRRQFAILIMALLFLTALASAEDEIVDLSHKGNGWNSFGEEADEIRRFQTFFAVATSIGKVQVKIRYLNGVAPNGDVIAEVFEANGKLPIDEALAQARLPKDEVITGDVNEIILECGGLKIGKEYAIALDQDPRQNNVCYEWNNGINLDEELQFGKFSGAWVDESNLGDGWLMIYPGQVSVPYAGMLAAKWADVKNR